MYSSERCDAGSLRSADAIASSLHTNLVDWKVKPQAKGAPLVAAFSLGD